jgi:hypothetical protein
MINGTMSDTNTTRRMTYKLPKMMDEIDFNNKDVDEPIPDQERASL